MERNYKKEAEWQKKKYKRFVLDINKQTAERFIEALEKNKTSYATWSKERINQYIEENEKK